MTRCSFEPTDSEFNCGRVGNYVPYLDDVDEPIPPVTPAAPGLAGSSDDAPPAALQTPAPAGGDVVGAEAQEVGDNHNKRTALPPPPSASDPAGGDAAGEECRGHGPEEARELKKEAL